MDINIFSATLAVFLSIVDKIPAVRSFFMKKYSSFIINRKMPLKDQKRLVYSKQFYKIANRDDTKAWIKKEEDNLAAKLNEISKNGDSLKASAKRVYYTFLGLGYTAGILLLVDKVNMSTLHDLTISSITDWGLGAVASIFGLFGLGASGFIILVLFSVLLVVQKTYRWHLDVSEAYKTMNNINLAILQNRAYRALQIISDEHRSDYSAKCENYKPLASVQ